MMLMTQGFLNKRKSAERAEKAAQKKSLLEQVRGEECKFCVIAKRKEAYVVFEDDETLAFLDINPLFPGHLLLIPKPHYATLTETPGEVVGALFNNAKLLSLAIEKGLGADGTIISVNNKVGQSIPHVHIHIVPRKFGDGFRGLYFPRYRYKGEEEMRQVQEKIIHGLKSI